MFSLGFLLFVCNLNVLDNFVNGAVMPSPLFKLDIVHYNDFHDRFEETSIPYPICKTNDDQCMGGFPRLYYEIKALLRAKPDALLLNAGDTFQGTYWYTLLKWNVTQNFINMLPNDAHTIGNHEFDDGVGGLVPYLAALKAPVVVANIDTSNEPTLNGLYQPHVILERSGRKIGIIGLITPDTPQSSNSQKVKFLDSIETVRKEAQLLTEKGIDVIIVLSHCGIYVDMQMAKEVGENIDIIVGGHTHSLLWNDVVAPSHEVVEGPYPVVVEPENKPGHKVLVVTAAAMSKYVGNLTTYFDTKGELQSFDGVPVFLNRSIPEDPKMKALLQPYVETLHAVVDEVVGYSDSDLLADPCGSGECTIGNLIADAFLNATQEKYETNLPSIAFLIRNMIRGSLAGGTITRGAIINTLPFTNKLATFVLQGKYLLKAFEDCLAKYWTREPFNGPLMPHVAGMKLTLNATAGQVVSASVWDGEAYQDLDPERNYQVTTVKFLLRGGNGFTMLRDHARQIQPVGTDYDLFTEYIKKKTPIKMELDHRLTVINK